MNLLQDEIERLQKEIEANDLLEDFMKEKMGQQVYEMKIKQMYR